MNLFESANQQHNFSTSPLATRMQPRSLDELVGQEHLLGPDKPLRKMIEADLLQSLIFFGPPGCGKTALAHVIARQTKAHFEKLNAVIAKVDDLRQVIKEAKDRRNMYKQRSIVFIDELHRFNKAQQDALLPDVEDGTIILIGATTQNPFHSVISALVSRSQVFRLEPLSIQQLSGLLKRALEAERGLKRHNIEADPKALEFLASKSEGDARKALNALELAVITMTSILTEPDTETSNHKIKKTHEFTLTQAQEAIQHKALVYDESEHYDVISAFIKSMRGSDPDAAIYWLAKMLYAGEDPAFIARRLVICASEDVGNADPWAIVVANAARETVEFVGMPEARIPLAQATIYIACAPKSNASYLAIDQALADIKENPSQGVPDHLKNAVYQGEKNLGIGKGYKYAHDFGGHVKQQYMPEPKIYYSPTENGVEKRIKERLEMLRS